MHSGSRARPRCLRRSPTLGKLGKRSIHSPLAPDGLLRLLVRNVAVPPLLIVRLIDGENKRARHRRLRLAQGLPADGDLARKYHSEQRLSVQRAFAQPATGT